MYLVVVNLFLILQSESPILFFFPLVPVDTYWEWLWCFVYISGALPGYAVAVTLTNSIKNKAVNDDIFNILKDLPNPNQDDDDGKYVLVFQHHAFR